MPAEIPGDLPPDVARFIIDHIGSVEELEILLLLHQKPERSWTAEELNSELRSSLGSVSDRLRHLADHELLVSDAGVPPRYRFQPAEERAARIVGAVAKAYRERRVTIITVIHSKPPRALRDLADAFRIGKGKSDG